MNYKNIYCKLIRSRKNRKQREGVYYEKHHIIPLFMFKENYRNKSKRNNIGVVDGSYNNKNNIVHLTAREHFLAHLLLYKAYKDTKWEFKCGASLLLFFNSKDSKHLRTNSLYKFSKKYENIKKELNECVSKNNKGKFPAKHLVTGERLGSVPVDHFNRHSGIWIHVSKGSKRTKEWHKNRPDTSGSNNNNYKELTENIKNIIFDTIVEFADPNGYFIQSRVIPIIKNRLGYKKLSKPFFVNKFGSIENMISELNKERNTEIKFDRYYRGYKKYENNKKDGKEDTGIRYNSKG